MKTLNTYNFAGKKALIRVDFNVPLNERYEITDDTRIKATIPTIQKIISDGGSAILMSHLGRPKGGPEEKYSLKHLVKPLSVIFGKPVKFADDCICVQAAELAAGLNPGEILLLENLRFYKEEEKGDTRINIERSNEALETGASVIAAACPFCNTMLTDGVKNKEKEDEVAVLDIAELVAASMV